jgi:hypothetical protein
MKGHLILLVCLFSVCFAGNEEFERLKAQFNLSPTLQKIWDMTRGILVGMHLEDIAPSDKLCIDSIIAIKETMETCIKHKKEGAKTLQFLDELTISLGIVPQAVRSCLNVTTDSWHHLKEYWEKFDNSFLNYLKALSLNIGWHIDDLVYSYFMVKGNLTDENFYKAGYSIGWALNIIVNVSSQMPIPINRPVPPTEDIIIPPMKTTSYGKFHDKFQTWFEITMVTLNFTKLSNSTVMNHFNESVWMIEYDIHAAISCFRMKKPDVMNGILYIVDILASLNYLLLGSVGLYQEVPKRIAEDNVFMDLQYFLKNMGVNAGFLIWDIVAIIIDSKNKHPVDIARRVGDLVNKLLFFSQYVIDDMNPYDF